MAFSFYKPANQEDEYLRNLGNLRKRYEGMAGTAATSTAA